MSPARGVALLAAGALGATCRYLVDTAVSARRRGPFPWGTLAVNVTGSFLAGFVTGLALYRGFPSATRVVLGTGFCGAYTTFSTFAFETVELAERGALTRGLGNALATLVTGSAAAAAGLALAASG